MKNNCMIERLTLYTPDLAVRYNEDFLIPLSCKKIVADMLQMLQHCCICGAVVELVDTPDLGSGLAIGGSSSLLSPTKSRKKTSIHNHKISYQRICNWLVGWELRI